MSRCGKTGCLMNPRDNLPGVCLKIVAAIGVFVLLCAPAAWAQGQDESPRRNVIIVTLNATRADHCTPYGYHDYSRNTTPHLKALAEEGVVFEQAFCQSSWTLPSLASLLTSTYVHIHGVYSRNDRLSDNALTLAEILKKYDYQTAAFVGGLDTLAYFGLSQGFDVYSDETGGKPMGSLKDTVPRAVQWLKSLRGKNFFLFIQGYDVHPPFNLPPEYRDMYDRDYRGVIDSFDYALLKDIRGGVLHRGEEQIRLSARDMEHIIARYDAAITYADTWVGVLLRQLKDMRLIDNTMVVVTAEHGEELGERGTFDRFGSGNLHDEVLHVPLIMRFPGRADPKRVACPVQSIDIMPTILDFLHIPVNRESQGVTLMPLVTGGEAGECAGRAFAHAAFDKWAMRSGTWKLIYDKGEYELYDLSVDFREQADRAAENPAVVYDLAQRFSAWDRQTREGRNVIVNRIELTDEMKKNLREAGYW